MHVRRRVSWLLLAMAVVISGCTQDHTIVGRWDMGRSNFYFRRDGVVYYLTSSKARYSGRWYFDDSTDPAKLVADMTKINGGGGDSLRMELDVNFLTADRVQFTGTSNGQRRATVASRMAEDLGRGSQASQSAQ